MSATDSGGRTAGSGWAAAMLVVALLGLMASGAVCAMREPVDCELGNRDGELTCDGAAPMTQSQRAMLGADVDLNAASAADLARLPGIGPRRAEAIIGLRGQTGGFCSVSQLAEVRGIGPRTVQTLQTRLVVGLTPDHCPAP